MIRLAFTSDVHTDSHAANRQVWQEMVAILRDNPPDVFVCCGDVAASVRQFGVTLFALQDLPCPKLLVPGNHDVWLPEDTWRQRGITSQDKYYTLLPVLCREAGFHPLWIEPYILGDMAFCGSMGWYDYSLRNYAFDGLLSLHDYRRKSFEGFLWNDARFVQWQVPGDDSPTTTPTDDEHLAAHMVDELQQQLQRARHDASRFIVVTHMLPFRTMVRQVSEPQRDYFNAFMGSTQLGELIQAWPGVELVLCGHTHRRMTVEVGGITARTSPLGYERQWRDRSPLDVARECLTFLDIA